MDPNVREEGGRTSLHTAVFSSDRETTQALIAANADVNEQDGQGISAVHWAASMGAKDCLDVLLDAGAFPNHTEFHEERLTPLDYAMMNGHDGVADRLRAVGGLGIGEVRELAAQHIQSWWTGFQTRITILGAWQQWLQKQDQGATTLDAVPEEDTPTASPVDTPTRDAGRTAPAGPAPAVSVVPKKQGIATTASTKNTGANAAKKKVSMRKKTATKDDTNAPQQVASPPRKPPVPRFSRKKKATSTATNASSDAGHARANEPRGDGIAGASTSTTPSKSVSPKPRPSAASDEDRHGSNGNAGAGVGTPRAKSASPNVGRKPRATPPGRPREAGPGPPPRKTGSSFAATQTAVLPSIVGSPPNATSPASALTAAGRTPPGSPLEPIRRDEQLGRMLKTEVGSGTDELLRRSRAGSPSKTKPSVSPTNRTSLAPARATKNQPHRSSPKKAKRHVRLIKNPHHLPSLNYYAQAMDAECPDLIDQGVPMPRAGDAEGDVSGSPEGTVARQSTHSTGNGTATGAQPIARELLRAKENVSMVTSERRRRNMVRAKIEAANIIQCAFRAWIAAGRPRPQNNRKVLLHPGRDASLAVSNKRREPRRSDAKQFGACVM